MRLFWAYTSLPDTHAKPLREMPVGTVPIRPPSFQRGTHAKIIELLNESLPVSELGEVLELLFSLNPFELWFEYDPVFCCCAAWIGLMVIVASAPGYTFEIMDLQTYACALVLPVVFLILWSMYMGYDVPDEISYACYALCLVAVCFIALFAADQKWQLLPPLSEEEEAEFDRKFMTTFGVFVDKEGVEWSKDDWGNLWYKNPDGQLWFKYSEEGKDKRSASSEPSGEGKRFTMLFVGDEEE